jgi:hypothetical protein
MGVNRKGSHIRYHVVLNDKDHYYQRTYPTALHDYCQARGVSRNYRKPLHLPDHASLQDITAAISDANADFELHLASITAANHTTLTEAERLKAARSFLTAHHLKPGMLYKDASTSIVDREMLEQTETVLLTTDFEEMADYGKAEHWFYSAAKAPEDKERWLEALVESEANMPEAIHVQKAAWKLLHENPQSLPSPLLFSDAWETYWPTVAYDGKEKRLIRASEKTKRDWTAFITHVGDQPFTELNANKALSSFLKAELNRPRKDGKSGKLSTASVRRRLVAPKATLNYLNDTEGLGYHIKAPKIKSDGKEKQSYTIPQDEQVELMKYISNEEAPGYAQWKELFILIAIQTGAYASELQRAEHRLLVLDSDPAYIVLHRKAKTPHRPRVVPLVFAINRMRYLANLIKDSSGLLLGASNSPERKDEGQISNELSKMMKVINPSATPRTLRHALAHNADVARIDPNEKTQLGGWRPTTFKLNPNQFLYGKQGLGNMERLRELAEASREAHKHLTGVIP